MEQLGLSMNTGQMAAAGLPAAQPARPAPRGDAGEGRYGRWQGTGGRNAEHLAGNVTEVILPPGQVENFQLLLPMLTQLNQERRWLAWIDPPQALVSKWQTMHGIVASELLVLRSTRDYSAFQLAERALGAGTCHAVVMWTSRLSGRDFSALEQASARGRSHGVILRSR
ncbi:MAG: cell division inhibitor SulA [Marinobacter sp.]